MLLNLESAINSDFVKILTAKQLLQYYQEMNQTEFHNQRIKEMQAEDEKLLEKCKINWDALFSPIVDEIHRLEQIPFGDQCDNSCQDKFMDEFSQTDIELDPIKALQSRLSKLECLKSDETATLRIEHLAKTIKEFPVDKSCQYSWHDVALSILRDPVSVELDYDFCPKCGKKRTSLNYTSSRWTWLMMCGVSGKMTVCPNCCTQEVSISAKN